MSARANQLYNDYNDLMGVATPDDAPTPQEDDFSQFINDVNPMDYEDGNDPNRLEFAKGGVVPRMNGMRRTNNGSTDTVPAMLTPEEYVVPRDVVLKKGTDFFDKIRDQARGMGKSKGAAEAPPPQAVPGPQGEMLPGYARGGLIEDLYAGIPQATDTLNSLVKNTVKDNIEFTTPKQQIDFKDSTVGRGMQRVADQAKADYNQPTSEMPGWIPNATAKVANVVFNPIERGLGLRTSQATEQNTAPDLNAPEFEGYRKAQEVQARRGVEGFNPANRFTETSLGGGMTRKTISPEYNDYLKSGGKPVYTDEETAVPLGAQLEAIPGGMSREQFNQNKQFDQYMDYARKEQGLAGEAADADYARQAANIVEEKDTNVVPLGNDQYATVTNTKKNIPGLINSATVKPNDFMTQQNTMATNQLNNLTEMQKEAMKENRAGLLKQNEEAKKSFADLNEVILGGWNKQKGEVTPGMMADEPEQAVNYFKSALSAAGVPSTVFDGLAVAVPAEGSNIMTIYDPSNPTGPKLSGTPSELASKIYEDHNSRR